MYKKLIACLMICTVACTQSYKAQIKNILSNHLQPTEASVNKLSIGETIVFQYGEKMGIDRSKYPSPIYEKNIDKNFFQYIKTETIDDGSDGGMEYSFEIYKAIKAGTTKIEVYKSEGRQLSKPMINDTIASQNKILNESYNFSIKD